MTAEVIQRPPRNGWILVDFYKARSVERRKFEMADTAAIDVIKAHLGQRSIVLVGLMGCGKTSVGKRLAARLALPFVDADEEIEKVAAKSITEIFTDHGEEFFRDRERKVIARLLKDGPQVLATGGGAYMHPETRAGIKASSLSIWLHAELPVLMRRVSKRDSRPLLKTGNPETTMRKLMENRYPVYANADITVQSRDDPHDLIVSEILGRLSAMLQEKATQSSDTPQTSTTARS